MAKLKHPLPPTAVRSKPDRLMRAVVLAWVVVGAILLMTLFKVVRSVGLFSFAGSVKPGVCRAIALYAPGDLAYDAKGGTLFIASAREGAPAAIDGLYVLKPGSTALVGSGEPVIHPKIGRKIDYEGEFVIVIGKRGKQIRVEDAYQYVAGYTILNDVSARDLNRRTDYPFKHDWFRGKSFDTFAPLGPWFVPRDVIRDPQNLRMTLSVNGETMQNDTTAGMIFNIAEQIAYLSGILTLKPGDLIATGTPTGVGMGRGVYLKAGDVMVAGIEGIGAIENRVVAQRK